MIPASNLFGIAAGLVALIALLIFLNALSTARRAKRATYYVVRREAQRTANRRLSLAISTFVLAGILWLVGRLLPGPTTPPQPSLNTTYAENSGVAVSPAPATIYPDPTPVVTVVAVTVAAGEPAPTIPPIPSPTLQPSPQATPIPEPTSALTAPVAMPTQPDAVLAEAQTFPDRRLVLSAIASGIDANGAPIGTGTTFTRGVETIYVFFNFRDVPPSALLRHAWFRDGGSVFFRSKRLTRNGQGTDYVSWSPPGGFQPGLYEVRITLGGVPQFVANFEVR